MGAKVKHLTTPDNSGAGNRENDSGNEGGSERAGSLVQDVGSHILVLGAKLSSFPADIRPRIMAMTISLLMVPMFGVYYGAVILPNCPEIAEDVGCIVTSVTWPLATLIAGATSALVIFRCSRKLLLIGVPASVFTMWILDTVSYIIAAATSSRALYVDAGGPAIMVRAHTISGMVTTFTIASVLPPTFPRAPLWVAAFVIVRLAATSANYISVLDVDPRLLAVSIPASILGSIATASFVRPSWVFLRPSDTRSGASMKGSTNVRQAQKITRRAGQLKVLAWTAIIVNAIVTCLPGELAFVGVIPTIGMVTTILAYAVIRASTLAHEGLHSLQLRAIEGIAGGTGGGGVRVAAAQSIRKRRPTRVILRAASSAHSSSQSSSNARSGRPAGSFASRGSTGERGSSKDRAPVAYVSRRSGPGSGVRLSSLGRGPPPGQGYAPMGSVRGMPVVADDCGPDEELLIPRAKTGGQGGPAGDPALPQARRASRSSPRRGSQGLAVKESLGEAEALLKALNLSAGNVTKLEELMPSASRRERGRGTHAKSMPGKLNDSNGSSGSHSQSQSRSGSGGRVRKRTPSRSKRSGDGSAGSGRMEPGNASGQQAAGSSGRGRRSVNAWADGGEGLPRGAWGADECDPEDALLMPPGRERGGRSRGSQSGGARGSRQGSMRSAYLGRASSRGRGVVPEVLGESGSAQGGMPGDAAGDVAAAVGAGDVPRGPADCPAYYGVSDAPTL